jgi:hypothetical protein
MSTQNAPTAEKAPAPVRVGVSSSFSQELYLALSSHTEAEIRYKLARTLTIAGFFATEGTASSALELVKSIAISHANQQDGPGKINVDFVVVGPMPEAMIERIAKLKQPRAKASLLRNWMMAGFGVWRASTARGHVETERQRAKPTFIARMLGRG